jgi:hypothetical protein
MTFPITMHRIKKYFYKSEPISTRCFSYLSNLTSTSFSQLGSFFNLFGKELLRATPKVLKDFIKRPKGSFYTLIKLSAGSWLCHACISNPSFTHLNLGSKVALFVSGWLSFLLINAALQWNKEFLGTTNLLLPEKKPLTRTALAIMINAYFIVGHQLPAGDYVTALLQMTYASTQISNLSEIYMNILENIKSTTQLAPFTNLLQYPLELLGNLFFFLKELFNRPKEAMKNSLKFFLSEFNKFCDSCNKGEWKELLARFVSLAIPLLVAGLLIGFGGWTNPISISLAVIITLALIYTALRTCDEHWPHDD